MAASKGSHEVVRGFAAHARPSVLVDRAWMAAFAAMTRERGRGFQLGHIVKLCVVDAA
jgi:hypothetical protein